MTIQKRTMWDVKEHIGKDQYLWDDLGINKNTGRNAVQRNVITAKMYDAIIKYCIEKKLNIASLFYKTVR